MTILIKIVKNIGSKCKCGDIAKYRYFDRDEYFCEKCYQTRCHKCRSIDNLKIRESNDLLCDNCYKKMINRKGNKNGLKPKFYKYCIKCKTKFEDNCTHPLCLKCFKLMINKKYSKPY